MVYYKETASLRNLQNITKQLDHVPEVAHPERGRENAIVSLFGDVWFFFFFMPTTDVFSASPYMTAWNDMPIGGPAAGDFFFSFSVLISAQDGVQMGRSCLWYQGQRDNGTLIKHKTSKYSLCKYHRNIMFILCCIKLCTALTPRTYIRDHL